SVSDTGMGMPPEIQSRAFEPFFTTKQVGEGTGLGLSQVYGFVKQSGGHIKIYSEVGEGTTLKIYLPRLTKASRPEEDDRAASPPLEGEASDTILVVEDDQDVRLYLTELLRELNYRVLEAADAVAALVYIEQRAVHIDLMLT